MKTKKTPTAREGAPAIALDLEERAFDDGFQMIGRFGPNTGLGRIVHYLNIKYLGTVIENDGAIDLKLPPPEERLKEGRFRRYCAKRLGGISLWAYKRALWEQHGRAPASLQNDETTKKGLPMT